MPKKKKHPSQMTDDEALKHIFHPEIVKSVKKHVRLRIKRTRRRPKSINHVLDCTGETTLCKVHNLLNTLHIVKIKLLNRRTKIIFRGTIQRNVEVVLVYCCLLEGPFLGGSTNSLIWRRTATPNFGSTLQRPPNYGKRISGPILAFVALVFLLLTYIYGDSPERTAEIFKYSAITTGGMAVLFIFFAQYDAWREEHIKYEDELKANQSPCLKGMISNFRLSGAYGHGFDGNQHTCNVQYSFSSYTFRNHADQ